MEYRLTIGDFAQRGPADLKFQVEGVALTNHSFSQKTRLNDISYGIKIWTDLSSVLSQSPRLTDSQTDRQTYIILIARPRLRCMLRGKNRRRVWLFWLDISYLLLYCSIFTLNLAFIN